MGNKAEDYVWIKITCGCTCDRSVSQLEVLRIDERASAGRSAVHSSAEKPRFLPSFLPARADMILGSLRTESMHSLALVMLE